MISFKMQGSILTEKQINWPVPVRALGEEK